jgi:hypothetical protein
MRLLRGLLVLAFVVAVGWLAVRTVSFESTDATLEITIDKRKLREAGHELKAQGRRVADHFGHTLKQAGEQIEGDAEATRR